MTKHKAPKNKFRVIGFDSFDHESFFVGDYATKVMAISAANSRSGQMTIMYVHNDKGEIVYRTGSF